VELLQELYNRLEDVRSNLDTDLIGIEFNRLEEESYRSMVETPYNELLVSVEAFLTNIDNGIYDDAEEEFGELEEF
jgi:hypothetical protein